MYDSLRDKEVDDGIEEYEIREEDMKRGQEVDEYIKKHGSTPTKKGLVATLEGDEVKISMVNMEASDALAVIAGIIVKVSESTGVSPSHIQKDIKGFVKTAMQNYIDEKVK